MPNARKALLLTTLAACVALFCTYGFFFYRDNLSTHYPIKVISAEVFRRGEIPYWNFFDCGGQPLAGNPNSLSFYPDNVLYLFLPAHVAFNLHFLIHLGGAFLAVRALTRSTFGGVLYALSGLAISATAFYNLIVALVMVPLALYAVERRSGWLLGGALGLLVLAGEPVTIVGALLAVVIVGAGRFPLRNVAVAAVIAAGVAAPQLIAFAEIAGEVERSVPMSARTALNASIQPIRIVEIFFWPVIGFLNDSGAEFRQRLFSTIFLGWIAIPALARRSRYTVLVMVMLFLALGRDNPLVAMVVENVPSLRIGRYPEKFVLPLIVALTVLAADYFRRTPYKRTWAVITFVPLLWTAWRAAPVDWFRPYEVRQLPSTRLYVDSVIRPGVTDARTEFRLRALAFEPLFGAAGGARYAINPSPDGMHALRSRMVVERFARADASLRYKYLRINAAAVPGALPPAFFVERTVPARDIYAEAATLESEAFDERTAAVVPRPTATAQGRVTGYREDVQTIEVDVVTNGTALLVVNQTFFRSWIARSGDRVLTTLPADVDRLGVIVPAGAHQIVLRFGRYRTAVAVTWIVSLLLLIAVVFAHRIEKLDGRPGEVERAAHEDQRLV